MSEIEKKKVLIIGGGLGGLSAAVYLSLAGFDVTIYESNERVGGRANLIERVGFRFDTGPSLLNYPWVFEQLFAVAGRDMKDYLELIPVEPSITFRWEGGAHLTLSSDVRTLLNECERFEPDSASSVFAFLRASDEKYQMAFDKLVTRNADSLTDWIKPLSLSDVGKVGVWKSLDKELKTNFKSRHLREAFGSYAMYLGGSPYDLPAMFTILAYGEMAYGLWLPKGGVYALVEAIERLATELGVKIQTNARVEEILTTSGSVCGIKLTSGEIINSSIVVSNVDVPTTNEQLLKEKKKKRKLKMTPGVVTFYWGVCGDVEGLAHHTIFLPDDYKGAFDDLMKKKRVPENLPFYVSVPCKSDATLAPENCTGIFVLAPTPLLSEMPDADWKAETAKIKNKVMKTLAAHNVKLAQEKIFFEETYTPLDWKNRFGLYDGSAFGAAHTLLQIGPFRSKNFSEEIKGLYYVGASTTPGTGMPMVVLGGKLLAERILKS